MTFVLSDPREIVTALNNLIFSSSKHCGVNRLQYTKHCAVNRLQYTNNNAVMPASMLGRWLFVKTCVVVSGATPSIFPICLDNFADITEFGDLRTHRFVRVSYITEKTSEGSTWSLFSCQNLSFINRRLISQTTSRWDAYFRFLRVIIIL